MIWVGLVAGMVAFAAAMPARMLDDEPTLRITSPLGRTGLPGVIRVVARLDGVGQLASVRADFYVDGQFLERDEDGPPFDAHWTDDSPFEPSELMVQVELPSGTTLTATQPLKPLQVTESSEVMSVALEASVRDAKGRFIRDLGTGEFEVLEDGASQRIDMVSQQREPALFALLVDSSQSMAIRSQAVRQTAARLLAPLERDDQIVVAPFSTHITSVTGPTTDRATVVSAIDAIKHAGGTAIMDALTEASSSLAPSTRRRAIVLISDGYDEHSESAFAAAVDALRKNAITLYVVGLGGVAGISLKGEKLLSDLARETGGRAWFPRDERQLVVAYDTIAMDVHHKYLLTYTPQNQSQDGTWRSIEVRARIPDVQVQARKGYTAPLAPPVRSSIEFTAIGKGQVPVALTRDDLRVFEDGVLQDVDTFHEAVLPVTFMLALDGSGSMKRSSAEAQNAAREFVLAMRPEDKIGMIVFADTSEYIHSPTLGRDHSLEAVDKYVADGGTALYDALYDSLAQIQDVPGRRVVVVVTDGRDENRASNGPGSLRTWEDVLRKLTQSEATVYAIGLGPRIDRERLEELADRSGGAAYFPERAASLSADYNKILDELRRRYVLGYESTNRIRNGRWRRVEIRPKDNGVLVRSRGGYYAPAQ